MEFTPRKSQNKSSTETPNTVNQSTACSIISDLKLPILDSGELGQIQELLFGSQLLAVSNHFDTLWQYTDQQLELIRKDYAEQINSLRKRIDVGLSEIAQKQQSGESEMSDKLAKAGNALEQAHLQLSSQISDVGTRLAMDFTNKNEAIQQRVDDAIQQLSDQKIDRNTLLSLLSDVASQLANSTNSPKATGTKIQSQNTRKNVVEREES